MESEAVYGPISQFQVNEGLIWDSLQFPWGKKKGLSVRTGPVMGRAATYSPGCDPSTIGAAGLNFSVRDGKRWGPCAGPPRFFSAGGRPLRHLYHVSFFDMSRRNCNGNSLCPSFRAISTARLCRCRLYTCSLSTLSSTTALCGSLILGWVSHLDAFSAYPFPT